MVCFIFYYAKPFSICFTLSAVIHLNSWYMSWIFPVIHVKIATYEFTMNYVAPVL